MFALFSLPPLVAAISVAPWRKGAQGQCQVSGRVRGSCRRRGYVGHVEVGVGPDSVTSPVAPE